MGGLFQRRGRTTNIPENRAAPQVHPFTPGVYEFCGFAEERDEYGKVPGTQCTALRPWDALLTNNRKMAMGDPVTGRYDEREPRITVGRIQMMQDAGVRFMVKQIGFSLPHALALVPEEERGGARIPEWAKPFSNAPLLMAHCADNHAGLDTPVKFSVSRWGDMSAGGNPDQIRERATYWADLRAHDWTPETVKLCERLYARLAATRYMGKDTYDNVDGKPVLFMGNAESLRFYEQEFGIAPEQLVKIYRDEVRAVTNKELFLMACNTPPEFIDPSNESVESPGEMMYLKLWGFDGFSPYALHGHGWAGAMGAHRYWRRRHLVAAKAAGLKYWPAISVGYDAEAWDRPEPYVYIPTEAEFIEHVREVKAFTLDNFDVTGGRAVEEALSEIGEGSISEGMQRHQLHDGNAMIRAFARAVA